MATKHKMGRSVMRTFGVGSRVNHSSQEFYQRKMFVSSSAKASDSARQHVQLAEGCLETIYVRSSACMSELPNESVHLMVTSPPYNVGKDYDDDLTQDDYRCLLRRVWRETYRVLVDGGRACINVANIGRKPYVPLHAFIVADMLDIGFLMRGEIIWNKAASAGVSCAWGSWLSASNPVLRDVHEYILVFSKGDFARAKTAQQTSTIDKESFLAWTKSIWTFPAESAKRVGHPAPYPVALPQRLIELYTFQDDIILDPFMGSGTTAVAAIQTKRRWVGYEISQDYAKRAGQRIDAMKALQHPSALSLL